jgi:hypothetical protein
MLKLSIRITKDRAEFTLPLLRELASSWPDIPNNLTIMTILCENSTAKLCKWSSKVQEKDWVQSEYEKIGA